ncbi:MAG: hypothetical protein ACRERE_10205 [Candidatus Entotheonellia bacterium]
MPHQITGQGVPSSRMWERRAAVVREGVQLLRPRLITGLDTSFCTRDLAAEVGGEPGMAYRIDHHARTLAQGVGAPPSAQNDLGNPAVISHAMQP